MAAALSAPMTELKFHKNNEHPRQAKPSTENIYAGKFKFCTQSTAVYDDYCLVDANDEIMKINASCERAFWREGCLALQRNGKIEIYKDLVLEETIPLDQPVNIHDFLPNFVSSIKRLNDTGDVFAVGDMTLTVTKSKIVFNGKEYKNEIHEDGCRYFVAWSEKVAVVGNDKAINFVYFYDGEPAEVEEYSPLSLRIDEDSLDSVPVLDIKFWRGKLLLIDEDVINVFSVNVLEEKAEPKKVVAEYRIESGELIKEGESRVSKHDDENTLSKKDESTPSREEESLSESISDKEESSSKAETHLTPVDGLKSSIGSLFSSTASFTDLLKKHKDPVPKPGTVFSPSVSAKIADAQRPMFDMTGKTSIVDLEKTPAEPEKDSEVKKIDRNFTEKLETLKREFASLRAKPKKENSLVLVPSNFDLEGLYNLIFSDRIREYEDAVSNMIFQVENMRAISESEVQESVKYIDSKIFGKKIFKHPVKYQDALCVNFNRCVKISSPFDDLLEGIKVLSVQEERQGPRFELKSAPKVPEKTAPAPVKEPAAQLPSSENTLKVSDMISPVEAISPVKANDAISPAKPSGMTSPVKAAAPLNLSSISLPYGAQLSPGMAQAQPKSDAPLFNNVPQNINNGLFIHDTSTLFNNIASNSLSVPNSSQNVPNTQNQQMNPNQPPSSGAPNGPVSAFNRLAGSRRLFQ